MADRAPRQYEGDECPVENKCVVSGRLVRLTDDRRPRQKNRAAKPKRKSCSKVGASSRAATRSATSPSVPKARSTSAAARARSTPTPTTGSTKTSAATRPANARDEPLTSPTPKVARCARRACCARAEPATVLLSGTARPDRSRTPAKAGPATREAASPERERPTDRRLRLPQPVPLRRQPAARRRLRRQRRRQRVGGDRPRPDRRRRSTTRVGPDTKGRKREQEFAFLELERLQTALRRRRTRRAAVLLLLAHSSRWCLVTNAATTAGSAISGEAFYEGSTYPAEYDNALFFSDSVRGCIYVMLADEDGEPDPATVRPFLSSEVVGLPGRRHRAGTGRLDLLHDPRRRDAEQDRLRPRSGDGSPEDRAAIRGATRR